MRRRTMLCVLVAVLGEMGTLAGCNALNGTGNLVEAKTDSTQDEAGASVEAGKPAEGGGATDGGAGARAHDAHAPNDSAATVIDASEASLAEAGTGLCSGLAMVMRFDGVLTTAQGQQPSSAPSVSYTDAVYGKAVVLANAPVAYAGNHLSIQAGTISMWIAGSWDAVNDPCPGIEFWSFDGDPYTYCSNDSSNDWYGFGVDSANQYAELYNSAPWQNGFNHVVASWSQSPPRLTFTVNGTTVENTASWTHAAITTFLLSGATNPIPAIAVDDVAIWTRQLSPTEIAAVQSAGKSIADVCSLP